MTSCANAILAGALDVSGDLSGRAAELLPGAQIYSTLVALVDLFGGVEQVNTYLCISP